MFLPRALHDELLALARREAPNEACAIVGVRDARAELALPVTNDAASPLRFEMNPREQLHAVERLEEEGLDVAIFHSHTRSAPYPSQTDVNFARWWPGATWLIAGTREDEMRAYRIEDGRIAEEELHLV